MYYSKKNYEDLKEMIINNPAYIGIIFCCDILHK